MVNSRARAIVEDGATVDAPSGDVTVAASDDARHRLPRPTMYSEVAPANDAGAGILNKWANQSLAEYKFTQHSGTREVVFGDKVRADDGTIYQYMGTTQTIDLVDRGLHRLRLLEGAHAGQPDQRLGGVRRRSRRSARSARRDSYFLLVDHNDLRSAVEAHLLNAPVTTSGDVTVSATEVAEMTAFDDSVTSSWNGQGRRRRHQRDALEREGVRRGRRRQRRERDRPRREHLDDGRHGDLEDRGLGQPSASCSRSTRSAGSRRTCSSTSSTPSSATR